MKKILFALSISVGALLATQDNTQVSVAAIKKLIANTNITATGDKLELIKKFELLKPIQYARVPIAIEDVRKINNTDYVARIKAAISTKSKRVKIVTDYITILDNGSHIVFSGVLNTKTMKKDIFPVDNKSKDSSFVLDPSYYDSRHLILGNSDSKNKAIIFSDPLCPACLGTVPAIIDKAKDKDIAIYYYEFPLESIHPAAITITKASLYAKKHNLVDNLVYKIYTANFSKFNRNFSKITNQQVILDAFNKQMKTNITIGQISTIEIAKAYDDEMMKGESLGINGTPTIIFNGKKSNARNDLQDFLF